LEAAGKKPISDFTDVLVKLNTYKETFLNGIVIEAFQSLITSTIMGVTLGQDKGYPDT
jgi:hypothetical protein